ncbi:hypothetical protein [Streptomyces sp. H27-C3]|uniref:hypothetical protein n=1 Tax=Streptomyces sp. H27-C3 TaxID=3046305 RepID=UPI0024B94F23|nr:hypothetical protein [Streptomyces sp. H27-C3]MDJ0460613.1 hypothetical protein [Streptomyces sp. H27-C3]
MHERTDHTELDEALRRILTEPTHAARLLTEAAALLDENPFLVLTEHQYREAAGSAGNLVLAGLPFAVASGAATQATAAMPEIRGYLRETNGEYAMRLRSAARGL